MTENTPELAYDLRQKYAEIVGLHLEAITEARILKDYPKYFKSLENLFTIIKHKFKNKKETVEEKEEDNYTISPLTKLEKKAEKKTQLEIYTELRKIAIEKANKYENAFLGRTEDPKEVTEVENSLREIEMFLYFVMDKASMFGSVSSNRGL